MYTTYTPAPIRELKKVGKPVRIFKADEDVAWLRVKCGIIRRTTFTRWMEFWQEGRINVTNAGINHFGEYIDVEYPKEKAS